MTKSSTPRRRLAHLALLAAPAAASAQPVTPAEAIARQREEIRNVIDQVCAPPAGPDEVVVCGRRPALERYRVPMSELPPGSSRRETAGGEQLRAMEAGSERCSTVGPMPRCGGVDFLGMGIAILRAVVRGIEQNRD